ncbi:ATP-binding protein [Amycolatopsis sp. cmx-4-54]|uniref:ATP-binding protein n=1 Tax=Amycolatopsis sp. cmx-4-54 TaxID=2790936 RepID=UPI00397BA9FE
MNREPGFTNEDDFERDFRANIDVELERLTQRVAWTAEIKLDLTKRPEPRRVRSTVANCLGFGRSREEPIGAVLLVLDELVANAYRYTTPGELRVTRQPDGILIEVSDEDPGVENMQASAEAPSVQSDHGLRFVAHLSLEWGTQPEGKGKVVWALVPAKMYYER